MRNSPKVLIILTSVNISEVHRWRSARQLRPLDAATWRAKGRPEAVDCRAMWEVLGVNHVRTHACWTNYRHGPTERCSLQV